MIQKITHIWKRNMMKKSTIGMIGIGIEIDSDGMEF